MSRAKLILVALLSVACLIGGWMGIVSYVKATVHENNRGWCDLIQAAQPRTAAEQPKPGLYGDRLLQALDRRGQSIGCSGITPRR